MIIKNYKEFLFEKQLTIPELNKDIQRWNSFLNKLKKNDIFELEDGSEVKILNSKEIIDNITDKDGNIDIEKINNYFKSNRRYLPVIKTDKGDMKLTDFKKTIEFGGGSGSSLGTEKARIYETIQSLYFSLIQKEKRYLQIKDIHNLFIDYADNFDMVNDELQHHIRSNKVVNVDDVTYFDGWTYTYIKTSNEFYNELDKNKTYIFYHSFFDGGVSNSIKDAFNRCIKSVNKEVGLRINISKWNPSDIWAVNSKLETEIINNISECENITDLNTVMDSYFDNKDLLGISLKKLPVDSDINLIINKNIGTKFEYDYTSTSKEELGSMSIMIHAKSYSDIQIRRKEKLEVRTFNSRTGQDISFEVVGETSKYGKTNINYVNYILNKFNIGNIPHYNNIKLNDDELIEEINILYNTIPNLEKTETRSKNYNIEDNRNKLVSKYQSLIFAKILEENKKRPAKTGLLNKIIFKLNKKLSISDYIMKQIFSYAYSMGGELFENTKFYRIKTIKMN